MVFLQKKNQESLMLGFGMLRLLACLLLICSVMERVTAKCCFSLPASTHFSPAAQTLPHPTPTLRYHHNPFVFWGSKTLGAPGYCSAPCSAELLGTVAGSSRAVSHTRAGPAEYGSLLTRPLPRICPPA